MSTLEDRFWSKVAKSDGCWQWTAHVDPAGYGRFGTGRKVGYAHRVAYEMTYGPIAHGLVIDHKCHTRACVNPDHLHAVTRKQNIENRAAANSNNVSSGVRGVSWSKAVGKWHVYLRESGATVHGGYFDDIADAKRAAIVLRNNHFTNNLIDRKGATA